MLTTCDLIADTVDICANLGGVLETVHLRSLLVAPAVLEAAAVAGRGGVRREAGSLRSPRVSGWFLAVVWFKQCTPTTHMHTLTQYLNYIAYATGALIIVSLYICEG